MTTVPLGGQIVLFPSVTCYVILSPYIRFLSDHLEHIYLPVWLYVFILGKTATNV